MRAMLFVLAAVLVIVAFGRVAGHAAAQAPPRASLPPGAHVTSRYDEAGLQQLTVQNQSTQTAMLTFARAGDEAQVTITVPVGNAVRLTGDATPSAPVCSTLDALNVFSCTIAFSPIGSFFAFTSEPIIMPTSTPAPVVQSGCGPRVPTAAEAQQGSLSLSLNTDKATFAVGEPVQFVLRATNVTNAPVTVTFSSSLNDEYIVRDANGATAWRLSEGRAFLTVLTSCTVQPGATLTFSETWNQRTSPPPGVQVPPGLYSVTALLTDLFVTSSATFTITQSSPAATAGHTDTVQLIAGCTNVVLTWDAGTPLGTVVANIAPAGVPVSIFKVDGRANRFLGYSPTALDGAHDYQVVGTRFEAVFICMPSPGTLTRPAA